MKDLFEYIEWLIEHGQLPKEKLDKIIFVLKKLKQINELDEALEKEDKKYKPKINELLKEISDILGIRNINNNAESSIALYNYMQLIFSNISFSSRDYLNIDLSKLVVYFDPHKIGASTGKNYYDKINSIRSSCKNFCTLMNDRFEKYEQYPSSGLKADLDRKFKKFISELLDSIAKKNEYVITSIRNGVDHGCFSNLGTGKILVFDQSDHGSDFKKFTCVSTVENLVELTKSLETLNEKNLAFLNC